MEVVAKGFCYLPAYQQHNKQEDDRVAKALRIVSVELLS